jgi:hypothetical protein
MFRFAKPNGESFDFDYEGPIHAFDGGNDLIAVCRGKEVIEVEEHDCGHECTEECLDDSCDVDCDCETEEVELVGDPRCWDDWEIVVTTNDEEAEAMLMQAIAIAYNAMAMCERMVLSGCPEEDE